MTTQQHNDAMRAVNLKIYGLMAASAAALAGVGMISDAVNKTVAALPASTTAGLATSVPVTLVSMCGFGAMGIVGAAAFTVAWRTPRATQRQQRDDEPVIVASPRPAQIAQQPIRQLPPPMAQNEPRFAPYRGDIAAMVQREQQRAQYAEPMPTMAQDDEYTAFTTEYEPTPQHSDNVPPSPPYEPTAPINERITARLSDGREITINTASWLAFVALTKINRDDWRQQLKTSGGIAPNSDFTQCKLIANEYKLLSGQGGWISENLKNRVTDWLINP